MSNLLTDEKTILINDGQKYLLDGNFESAYKHFEKYRQRYPDDPVGLLFKAAIMQSEMMDSEDNLYGKQFELVCDSIEIMALNIMQDCSRTDSALCYLYLGHRCAYQSLWEARFGSTFSALKYGFRSKKRYNEGLECDSTLYDLYLGLGSYHYWKTVKAGFLRTIGLFRNEKEKGIKEVYLAIDSSRFSREASVSSLIWILINEKKYDSAIVLSEMMFEKYPNGNSFLYPLGEAYYKSEKYGKAREVYGKLFDRLQYKPGNYYNLIETAYYINESDKKSDKADKESQSKEYIRNQLPEISKKIKRSQHSKLKKLFSN